MLPEPSLRTSSPMPSATRRNHSCASTSSGVHATRFQPVSVRPISASSANHRRNRSRETAGIGSGRIREMSAPTMRLPGFVNAHSHAFQRGMRGVVERVDPAHPHDDFWTWREEMYAAAGRIDPDSAHAIALLAYGEMVAAGFVAVGEFHYVHHRPDGSPYAPANAMSLATAAAADEAGIDQVLLMTAYERAGAGLPPTPGQRRVCDPDAATDLAPGDALAAQRPRGPAGLAPPTRR